MFDRFTKTAATAVLALGVAGGASAQGLGSYSGPYVGLMFGYGAMDLEIIDSAPATPVDSKESATGFDLAGFVGYEVREDRLYYAIEAELLIPFKESDMSANFDEFTKDMTYAANLRGGYFLTDGTLVYGLLGLEIAEFTATDVGAGATEESESVMGVRLGAGAEFRATESLSIRAEYIYTIYEDMSVGLAQTEIDPSDSTFRVGGVYRFSF